MKISYSDKGKSWQVLILFFLLISHSGSQLGVEAFGNVGWSMFLVVTIRGGVNNNIWWTEARHAN